MRGELVALGLALSIGPACAKGASGASGTGGAGHAATSSAATGSGGRATGPCTSDADCAGDLAGGACDAATGSCVACLPSSGTCAAGQYCDPAAHACATGCSNDADCASDPAGAYCDTQAHACVGCVIEDDCPAGQLCSMSIHVCVPGCSPTHGCQNGDTCCTDTCYNLSNDRAHCGGCSTVCTDPPNATGACKQGACMIANCLPAFADCDDQVTDGCEWNTLQDGPCACAPGATQSCYFGAPGTLDVGPCKSGVQTCDPSGTAWGACLGQVLPQAEICNNGVDDDCNGTVDDVADIDGDGWTVCDGDCCEIAGPGCTNPRLVNPGAYEVVGDGVDNDCDPSTSDVTPPPLCSTTQKLSGVTGADVAMAMDLCQFTTASPPLAMKKWGVISAQQLKADGSIPSAAELANMQDWQASILTHFGTGGVTPKQGATMAGLSSGRMRDEAAPGFIAQNGGTGFSLTSVQPPIVYTAAHSGNLAPGHCGATTCLAGAGAFDSINVRLQIRVPTNARSFSYDFRFFSAEYQSWQCTSFNDYYLALLQSGASGIPPDHDISFDAQGNAVSVNNGFFQTCGGNGKSCGACPNGTAALAGTGLEINNTGGGTLWLTTDAPVVPGETLQLELMIFDVSDDMLDSLVLLDNFHWSVSPTAVGTHT